MPSNRDDVPTRAAKTSTVFVLITREDSPNPPGVCKALYQRHDNTEIGDYQTHSADTANEDCGGCSPLDATERRLELCVRSADEAAAVPSVCDSRNGLEQNRSDSAYITGLAQGLASCTTERA